MPPKSLMRELGIDSAGEVLPDRAHEEDMAKLIDSVHKVMNREHNLEKKNVKDEVSIDNLAGEVASLEHTAERIQNLNKILVSSAKVPDSHSDDKTWTQTWALYKDNNQRAQLKLRHVLDNFKATLKNLTLKMQDLERNNRDFEESLKETRNDVTISNNVSRSLAIRFAKEIDSHRAAINARHLV